MGGRFDNHEDEKRKLRREYEDLTEKEKELDEEDSLGSQEEHHSEDSEEDEEESNDEEENNDDEDNDDDDDEDNDDEDNEDEDDEEEEEDDEDEDNEDEDNDDEDNEDNDDEDNEDESDDRVDSESRKNLNPDRRQNSEEGKESEGKEGKQSLKDKAADKVGEKIGQNSETIKNAMKAKEIASKGVAVMKSALAKSKVLLQFLINPYFWIFAAVVLIVVVIIAAFSVIGGNDYNKLCDNDGIGSVSIGDDADDFTRQSAIAAWLMSTPFKVTGDQPMNKEQASAVLGNLMLESYMANPKTVQGDSTMTAWQTCNNDCVIGWGGSGKAIGLVQWMGGRRLGLAQFAKSEGTEWHDLTTQLKYLKMELDGEGSGGDYDMNMLIKGGFGDPGKTLEDYTWIWQDKFERAGESKGDAAFKKREQYAQEFFGKFDGSGAGLGGGMVDKCVGGHGAVDASGITQLAIQIAYTREEKASGKGYGRCGGVLTNCGDAFSKPEYVEAKRMVEEETGKDPQSGLTASCDRLVATMIRLTGIDENFPYGSTGTQINYMNQSPDWEKASCQSRQPGDVFGKTGHIMIYVGEIEGRETVVSASIEGGRSKARAAHMSDIGCSGDSFKGDGMIVPGYRKVN